MQGGEDNNDKFKGVYMMYEVKVKVKGVYRVFHGDNPNMCD